MTIRINNGLLVPGKLQWVGLEAGFGKRFFDRAKSVLVATAMVVLHLPRNFGKPTDLPCDTSVHWWERGTVHAMVRVFGGCVNSSLGDRVAPRGTAGKTASVSNGGSPRCPPRVVLIDIIDGTRCGVAVDGSVFWVVDGGLFAQPTEIHLTSPAHVVAFGATDEASLRVPKRSLSILELAAGDVGAFAIGRPRLGRVDADEVIDGITGSRRHNGAVG